MRPSKLACLSLVVLLFAVMIPACTAPQKLANTINLNLSWEPPTLDPCLATDSASLSIIDGLFWGLTDINNQTNEATPKLATSWDVSDDGLVWTFHLRDDFYWVHYDPQTKKTEKKRQVTAHDVEYGAKRTIDPATASDYAYVDYIIENAYAVNTGENPNLDAIGVQALDDRTVQFTLEEPASYFAFIAGLWVNYPLPREAIDQYGEKWTEPGNLWSCGPYLLDTWEHENRIVQVKNPLFHDAPQVSIATVNWAMIANAATALNMYESGQLDSLSDFPVVDLARIRADSALSKELHIVPRLATGYLGFNVNKPPVDNRLVRKALAAAIDKQEVIDTLWGGAQIVAKTFAPPGIFGSPALAPNFQGIPFDPQQARQWLAEAGYPGGNGFPEIVFMFTTDVDLQKTAEYVQQQWKENLGIEVKLANQEWAVFLQTVHTDPPHIFSLGWSADYPDENNWVLEVFHPTKGQNAPQWSPNDPPAQRFMEVTEAAAVATDPVKRKELYFEAEQILIKDEAIIVPNAHMVTMYLTKPYVQRIFPVLGMLHIEQWKVRAH